MKPEWFNAPCAPINQQIFNAARARQQSLTKPEGALGELESIAVRLAAMQGKAFPSVDHASILVFAADHGIANESVSAYPQAVTAEMVRNFSRGGAAISVLAKEVGAHFQVVNLGTVDKLEKLKHVTDARLSSGTVNFMHAPAMSEIQFVQASEYARQAVERVLEQRSEIFIGGEMGIANTTSATALACALLSVDPEAITGPGTGLDHAGVKRKAIKIRQALSCHQAFLNTPANILQRLGGFEIVALTAAFVCCAQKGIPVLVDGFIASVAALAAERICPGASVWFFFGHRSAEPGHQIVLEALEVRPLLDLNMRLGEGSGAALALPVLRMACALHNNMATFYQAGVSDKS